jgi:hypothetical protein
VARKDGLVSLQGLAYRSGLSLTWLNVLVKRGDLPHVRLRIKGQERVFFKSAEALAILETRAPVVDKRGEDNQHRWRVEPRAEYAATTSRMALRLVLPTGERCLVLKRIEDRRERRKPVFAGERWRVIEWQRGAA